MPFYRFVCRACGFEKQKLTSYDTARTLEEACPECGGTVSFALGKPNAIGRETKDEYRGISNDLDVKEKLADRAHKHFMDHELDRVIAKEGKEFAIRQGWLNEDGTKKK
jgi:putative FmdB family regulatory protein